MHPNKKAPLYIFVIYSAFLVFHHIFGYFGHYGYDDMHYAEIARNFIHGEINFELSFTHRWTLILFTSLSYYFLGINDTASALPSLIISVSILFVVFLTLRKQGTLQTIIGLSLTAFINIFLSYTDKIMPDIYVVLFLLLSVFWIDKHRSTELNEKTGLYAFLFSFSLFLAFISKETAVLFLPFPLILFTIDLLNRQNIKFWLFSLLSGKLIISAYLVIMKLVSGSFFKRFEVLTAANQIHSYIYSYDKQPLEIIFRRIGYQLFNVYLNQGMLVSFIPIFAFIASSNTRRLLKTNDTFSLYIMASMILLISLNFMTISPYAYHPVPLDPRHSLFLIPIAAIAASYILKDFIYEKKYSWQIIIVSTLITIWALFSLNVLFHIYLLLTLLFLGYTLWNRKYKHAFLSVFILIFIIYPAKNIYTSYTKIRYKFQREIIFTNLINTNEQYYIFTDPVQRYIGRYYLGFDDNANCHFINYNTIEQYDFNPEYKKMLLLNYHTQFYSNTLDKMPYFARNIDASYRSVFKDSSQGLYIYEMPELIIPEISGKKIMKSFNDFEQNYENWSYDINLITHEQSRSGEKSASIPEYSPVFYYTIDSTLIEKSGNLFIKTDLHYFFYSFSTSLLVYMMEDENGVYFWEGIPLSKNQKLLASWNNISHELILDKSTLRPGSILKILIWNPGLDKGYVDDFQIKIYNL